MRNYKINKFFTGIGSWRLMEMRKLQERSFSFGALRLQQVVSANMEDTVRTDEEWMNAKDFNTMPGPTRIQLLMDYFPGGKLHNANLIDMHTILHSTYGDIFRIKGMLGKPDYVFTYNANDVEHVYRNEGVWPIRLGLDSFTYYRKVKRPDIFQGIGGLVSEQGKMWADIRNKVNPILMKVQNVRQNLPQIDEIANEFLIKLEALRDPETNMLSNNFHDELKMWAFESISLIALNTRMGLLSESPDVNAHKLAKNMSDMFQYSYEYDVTPSFWKYVETPGFKRLIRTYENITEITISYIEAAMKRFEAEGNKEAISVLEKLCRLDKKIAIVMVMDMLMAGIDTTSSAFVTTLYLLSKNQSKQDCLREELYKILPQPHMPLTEANTKQMPYLRACIKESLRITPITPGNLRMAAKNLVLSGYRVPKGTGVLMGIMALSNSEEYYSRSAEFLPERWLKSGENACPMAKSTNAFTYLPFGFGPRTCIGKRIAEMEIETLLARLIRNYRITWNSKQDLKYISNIVLLPHGNLDFKFEQI
ncbi:cytochrome P450 12b1, mitochondrial [Teleopsis dalmanni]|uniref:cytochrome P450 12b1, mitochondrial n=1 Tax=Teleopsis dalmanni TaxID=139649 RepID=UPI0018CFE7AC|nr:cytochrome P450 12b1, mitochondrial [Teleopsis dalmanni]